MALGYNADAIQHRIKKGRLHPVHRGVYAVGRPELTRHGTWMAAVLACGPGAVLSHASAAALWEMCQVEGPAIEVSTPGHLFRRRLGLVIHRRQSLTRHERTEHKFDPGYHPHLHPDRPRRVPHVGSARDRDKRGGQARSD
jgi:predicted transcriptional regulator of viral defense system